MLAYDVLTHGLSHRRRPRVLENKSRSFGLTIPAFDREVRCDIPSWNIVSSEETFLRWD